MSVHLAVPSLQDDITQGSSIVMFSKAVVQAEVATWRKVCLLVLALKQTNVKHAILPDCSFMMQGIVAGYQSGSLVSAPIDISIQVSI